MKANERKRMDELKAKFTKLATEKSDFRWATYYEACPAKIAVREMVLLAYDRELSKLREEYAPLRKKEIAEHNRTDLHKFLMASKGSSGFNILLNIRKSA